MAAAVEKGRRKKGMTLSSSTAALFYCGSRSRRGMAVSSSTAALLLRPFSIAAAAVEEQSCVLFSIAALLLRPFSIVAAAVEEERAILLLRPFSLYCGAAVEEQSCVLFFIAAATGAAPVRIWAQ